MLPLNITPIKEKPMLKAFLILVSAALADDRFLSPAPNASVPYGTPVHFTLVVGTYPCFTGKPCECTAERPCEASIFYDGLRHNPIPYSGAPGDTLRFTYDFPLKDFPSRPESVTVICKQMVGSDSLRAFLPLHLTPPVTTLLRHVKATVTYPVRAVAWRADGRVAR